MGYGVGVGEEKGHHYHSFSLGYIGSKSSISGQVVETVGVEILV